MAFEYYTYSVDLSQLRHQLVRRNESQRPIDEAVIIPVIGEDPAYDISLSNYPIGATYLCFPYGDSERVYDDYVDGVIVPLARLARRSHLRKLGVIITNKFNHLFLGDQLEWSSFVSVVQYPSEEAGLIRAALRRINKVYRGENVFFQHQLKSPLEYDSMLQGAGQRQVFAAMEDYRSTLQRRISEKGFNWGTALYNAQMAGWNTNGEEVVGVINRIKNGE